MGCNCGGKSFSGKRNSINQVGANLNMIRSAPQPKIQAPVKRSPIRKVV